MYIIHIHGSVVKNKPPRKASAENLGTFMPTCCFCFIFISFIYIDIDIYTHITPKTLSPAHILYFMWHQHKCTHTHTDTYNIPLI